MTQVAGKEWKGCCSPAGRVSGLVGLTSMLGSLGWFTAFTLQTAALVKGWGADRVVLLLPRLPVFWAKGTLLGQELAGGLAFVARSG